MSATRGLVSPNHILNMFKSTVLRKKLLLTINIPNLYTLKSEVTDYGVDGP
jgi:hypothetical protein